MDKKEIFELDGTKLDTLWITVEKGTLEDGTPYEKRIKFVPRTFEKAVQDENGILLSEKIKEMKQQISNVSGDVVGNIADLGTSEKETLVGAINEINNFQSELRGELNNSGIISQELTNTSITLVEEEFTFEKLINRKEVTFFTNWHDGINFPELYGSGIFIPGLDNRCNSIIYMTSPLPDTMSYPRKIFVGHVYTENLNIPVDGLTDSSVVWKEVMTNNEVSNPNLLINPNFRINQRGKNQYRGNEVYTVDRWILWNGVLTVVDDGVSIVRDNISSDYYELRQYVELNFNDIAGKKMSVSISVDGKEYSTKYTIPTSLNENYNSDIQLFENFYVRLNVKTNNRNILIFQIYNHGGTTHVINWAKLEFGSSPTAFVPPFFSSELLKCKWYYQEIISNQGVEVYDFNLLQTSIRYNEMRITPTPYFKNNLFNGNNLTAIVQGIIVEGFTFFVYSHPITNTITVRAEKTNHLLSPDNIIFVISRNNPVCLDAEIYNF